MGSRNMIRILIVTVASVFGAGWSNSWDTNANLACAFATYWKASEKAGSKLPEVYGFPEDPNNDHATAAEKCAAYAVWDCDCKTSSAEGHWKNKQVCDKHEENMGPGHHKNWEGYYCFRDIVCGKVSFDDADEGKGPKCGALINGLSFALLAFLCAVFKL